jgi:hypothetical protein
MAWLLFPFRIKSLALLILNVNASSGFRNENDRQQRRSGKLIPSNHNILRVKYFTARVSGSVDPDAPRRQRIYFNALQTVPEIELIFGSFLSKTVWRPIVNLPIGNAAINNTSFSAPIVLPPGNYRVAGTRPQTLVIGNYPPKRQRRARNTNPPFPDALISEDRELIGPVDPAG